MDKQKLVSGMLLKISIGSGRYGPKKKWASIIRVISVNRVGKGKEQIVTGLQFQTIAVRGGEFHPASHYKFDQSKKITSISGRFNEWWETFNAKILV